MTDPAPEIKMAARMSRLPPYIFDKINTVKLEKRRAGVDVIDLGMGNPMDPTPSTVVEKLVPTTAILGAASGPVAMADAGRRLPSAEADHGHSRPGGGRDRGGHADRPRLTRT